MAKTIVVLGVTGNQGGSVAAKFLSNGWHVRGVTRSTSSPAAQALASKGVELITADVDNTSSLVAAFKGAHVIFAMTDFWAPYFASFPELSKVSERAAGEHAFTIEVQRGKNLVDAAAEALKDGVLERFVYSTLPGFKKQSGGKYTHIYHFDSKNVVSQYLRGKTELWERSSLLNMGFYTSNFKNYNGVMGPAKSLENGVYIYRAPADSNAIHPFVVTSDTGLFMDLLVRSPPEQDLLAVSEMTTYVEFMKIWSEVTGIPSEVRRISIDEAAKLAPGGVGREAAESTATSAEFGWGKDLVLPWQLDSEIKTTSLRTYIEGVDWKDFVAKIRGA